MKIIKFDIPGRICLFGDKVDLLGLPVIGATINNFMHFEMETREDSKIYFHSREYHDEDELFSIDDKKKLFDYTRHLKYWHAALKVLEPSIDDGKIKGFSARVSTEVPIGSGLSTSAALTVGFLKGVNDLFNLGLSTLEIAEKAYQAEHDVLGIMCGRLDQYTISVGGVVFIETGDKPSIKKLDIGALPLVVGDSCEPREAKKVLNKVKKELKDGNDVYLKAFDAIHEVVLDGRKALEKGPDLQRVGELMTKQQEQENAIEAATEKINTLCKISIENGAYGAKQMGAGGGGCMVACCPDFETQQRVAKAINEAGGKAELFQIFEYKKKE
ncbi:MAG: mevalonate kinase [Candidatus Hodarchaeota archaeon]